MPNETQYLLNSHLESDSVALEIEKIDSATSAGIKKLKELLNKSKTNREIQIYLSTPFKNKQDTISIDCTFSLFNSRHGSFINNLSSGSSASNETLFSHLRSYCAQQINNCDLNIIDLNNAATVNNESAKQNNKYFKRLLAKSILSDSLNIAHRKKSFNYSSSCFLFVVNILQILKFS